MIRRQSTGIERRRGGENGYCVIRCVDVAGVML